ncbi:MAG: hypothetical protein KGH90_00185 [Xanthomonadaceae bacterium]|jgi:hypothetical protein|nr:hypothetical protein [Xanthomonadaceae bacterium]
MSKHSTQVPAVVAPAEYSRITAAILDFVSEVPDSKVDGSGDPATEARKLASRAAQRAALTAGSLALPVGPLGWLTLLPELVAIWKIQGQMVSDIAAAYGRNHSLGREQMLWCLFRHTAAQAFRDLVVQVGDRLIFRRMSYNVAERVARQIGVRLTERTVTKGLARWLPVIGALGVGAYAYYDTGQVASTAIALFESDTAMEDADAAAAGEEPTATPKAKSPARATAKTAKNAVGQAVGAAARKLAGRTRKADASTPRKPDKA